MVGGRFLANTRTAASAWAAVVKEEVAVVAVVEEVGEVAVVVVLPLLHRCRPPARSSRPRSPILQKPRTARRIRHYHRSRPRITQNTPYS
jgi:hypothetical protein